MNFSKLGSYLFYLVLIIFGASIGAMILIGSAKKLSDDANWFPEGIGIDESYFVELGGAEQFLRVRGQVLGNPVLIDLHGGPGSAFTPFTHRVYKPLTEYFTIVEWDQPGAGKSRADPRSEVSYNTMINTTVELVEHVREKLGVEKVVLVGHSWGSMLGLGVIKQRPDLFSAYVGVGQALAWNAGMNETQRLILEAARERGDQATIDSLSAISPAWPDKEDIDATLDRIATIQAPLTKYQGGLYASKSNDLYQSSIVLDVVTSPDIGIRQALSMFGLSPLAKELMKDLHEKDLRIELGDKFQVPMFIFQGEHDWQTPTSLVKPWFEELDAPHKEYIPFDFSAHMVINEEPGKYLVELVQRVRPLAL